MKHRHSGPLVKYRTMKNNVRYRKRPLHPKTGSWISKRSIHGPRVKQPNEFKDVYTVSQDWARKRHLKINPPDKESRIKVGTLKDNGLAVQSYITPLYKFKDKPYPYLRKKFGISKYGDDDKDGVPNYKDCRPWDEKKHGFFGPTEEDEMDEEEQIAKEIIETESREAVEMDPEDVEIITRGVREDYEAGIDKTKQSRWRGFLG